MAYHKEKKIIAYDKGINYVFNSLNDCAEFYKPWCKYIYAEVIKRRINDGGFVRYEETYYENNKPKTIVHEVFFDELFFDEVLENGKPRKKM